MEVLLFPAIIFAFYLWFRSYRAIFRVHQFRANTTHRTLSAVLPFFCMAFIVFVLLTRSSPDVRSNAEWIIWYTIGGAVWLQLGLFVLSLLGVAARDDVLERQNPAAAWVVYGTMIATTFCYAGSNIGSGPGAEVVLFCGALSTTFLFGFWFVLERVFHLADRVTIERDESAGIRIGGWIMGLGLIFGGAVAEDWVSVQGTIRDFLSYAWIAFPLLLGSMMIEKILTSSRMREKVHRGASITVAFLYLLAAAGYVTWRGVH